MAGYRPLKSLWLRDRRWTLLSVFKAIARSHRAFARTTRRPRATFSVGCNSIASVKRALTLAFSTQPFAASKFRRWPAALATALGLCRRSVESRAQFLETGAGAVPFQFVNVSKERDVRLKSCELPK